MFLFCLRQIIRCKLLIQVQRADHVYGELIAAKNLRLCLQIFGMGRRIYIGGIVQGESFRTGRVNFKASCGLDTQASSRA